MRLPARPKSVAIVALSACLAAYHRAWVVPGQSAALRATTRIRTVFKHFLLCRYNLGLYSVNPYNIADADSWMNARRPLFERLLRSLEIQTNQEFTLLVAVDPFTPSQLRGAIETSLQESGVPARILEQAPMEWLRSKEREAEYLITSRIDNDDEYLPRFVETIQAEFVPGTEVLDIHGVQCDGRSYFTAGRPDPNSPFLSLVEPWHDVKTAHFENHNRMNQLFPARFAGSDYLFIQYIHESNVRNRIVGRKLAPHQIGQLPPLTTQG